MGVGKEQHLQVTDATMKAAVHTHYGAPEVLRVQEVSRPVPQSDEILVRVHASTVNSGDWHMRKADPFVVRFMNGLTKPKKQILGTDFSGVVAAIGTNVIEFNVGDEVFGNTEMKMGTNAEYICISEKKAVVRKPANITHDEAAAIPFGASTSLFFLKEKGDIRPGLSVLINGASGALGVYGVQLAKHFGAEVTGVCSAGNVELVRSLGADAVVDYTKEDFTRNGKMYDLIYETVGNLSFGDVKNSLSPNGLLLSAAGGIGDWLQMIRTSLGGKKKVITGVSMNRKDQLLFFKQLMEEGHLNAVIDRRYPLDQTAEAHRYVEQGHKRGAVVITVAA